MENYLNLKPGLHCKACDAPLDQSPDDELCTTCLAVVYEYNKDILEEDEDDFVYFSMP